MDININNENETTTVVDEQVCESWAKQKGETSQAFGAFCKFRDYGPGRKINKVILSLGQDDMVTNRNPKTWNKWASTYHWKRRVSDYDTYIDNLRLAEHRRIIEERGEVHRQVTEKMLNVVHKKLDMMSPEELLPYNVTDWVKTAVQTERAALGINIPEGNEKQAQNSQPVIVFDSDFEGL